MKIIDSMPLFQVYNLEQPTAIIGIMYYRYWKYYIYPSGMKADSPVTTMEFLKEVNKYNIALEWLKNDKDGWWVVVTKDVFKQYMAKYHSEKYESIQAMIESSTGVKL